MSDRPAPLKVTFRLRSDRCGGYAPPAAPSRDRSPQSGAQGSGRDYATAAEAPVVLYGRNLDIAG